MSAYLQVKNPRPREGIGLAILSSVEASGLGFDFLIFLSWVNTGLSSSERLRKEKSLRVCSSGRRGRDESRRVSWQLVFTVGP